MVNIRKYTTFCGGINEDGESLKRELENIFVDYIYIKSALWGVAVRLSYI